MSYIMPLSHWHNTPLEKLYEAYGPSLDNMTRIDKLTFRAAICALPFWEDIYRAIEAVNPSLSEEDRTLIDWIRYIAETCSEQEHGELILLLTKGIVSTGNPSSDNPFI